MERRPPFRRIQNQEAHTDKVSQIHVTDDVTRQSGERYTEMSTSQGWRVVIYDLLLTLARGHHSSIEQSGEKIKHGGWGSNTDSAGVLRSIPPRFMLVAYHQEMKCSLLLPAAMPQLRKPVHQIRVELLQLIIISPIKQDHMLNF
jgi:hypothetical protein